MKALVVYDTKFGNTEHLARVIAAELGKGAVVEMLTAETADLELTGVDLLVVGGPTQMHGVSPTLRALLDSLPPHALQDIAAAAFDTRLHGMKLLTGSAAEGIAHRLEKHGAWLLLPPETFQVQASEGPLADGEAERAATWASAVLSEAQARMPALAVE